jgi:hypothetical protein
LTAVAWLERIVIDRTHFVGSINHDTLYFNKLEQTLQIDESPLAIPIKLDLL